MPFSFSLSLLSLTSATAVTVTTSAVTITVTAGCSESKYRHHDSDDKYGIGGYGEVSYQLLIIVDLKGHSENKGKLDKGVEADGRDEIRLGPKDQ